MRRQPHRRFFVQLSNLLIYSNNYKFWKICMDILKKCYKYLQYTVETERNLCYDSDIIYDEKMFLI